LVPPNFASLSSRILYYLSHTSFFFFWTAGLLLF
jgi:hypothetical protein